MFNKVADAEARLDDRLLFEVITVIFTKIKPDIFEIFRTFSRNLEIKREFPETYLQDICL